MPLEDLHRGVAAVALHAAASHGFALAGGCALIAHGVIDRPTEDVDLFTDREHGVEAAASAVEQGLRAAGFQTERRDKTGGPHAGAVAKGADNFGYDAWPRRAFGWWL